MSDPITTYLEDLARLLARKLPVKAVMEIVAEIEAHLRRTVEELGGTPDAESEAVARFGEVREVAKQIVRERTEKTRAASRWAFWLVALLPVWSVTGLLLFQYGRITSGSLYVMCYLALPALTGLAYSVSCFRSRRMLLVPTTLGYVAAVLWFSVLTCFLYVTRYPFNGYGYYFRPTAMQTLADMESDSQKLLPTKKLWDDADLFYRSDRKSLEGEFHNPQGYLLPASFDSGFRDRHFWFTSRSTRVPSLKEAKHRWSLSLMTWGAVRRAYQDRHDSAVGLGNGLARPPLAQLPEGALIDVAQTWAVYPTLLGLNLLAFLAGLIYDWRSKGDANLQRAYL